MDSSETYFIDRSKAVRDAISSYDFIADFAEIRGCYMSNTASSIQDLVDKAYDVASRRGVGPVPTSHMLGSIWTSAHTIPSQIRALGVKDVSLHPFAMTASSNVNQGVMAYDDVALKTFRRTLTQPGSDEDVMRLFLEATILPTDLHPNILPVRGIHICPSGDICLVTKFMKNGALPGYLASHPEVDKLDILVQLADAVTFLHGLAQPILHGDIRGFNILVGDSGEPLLMDFGFSLVAGSTTSEFGPSCHAQIGNIRWTAKEKMAPSEYPLTLKADCFSFASLILEVLSGDVPYAHLCNDGAVIVDVMVHNKLPPRPSSPLITDALWDLMRKCWSSDPAERPTMQEIHDFLVSVHSESSSTTTS